MRWQNDLFRSYALGNFALLCIEVAKDRAMLFWLDNYTSVKEHPNENFGRELLERRGRHPSADEKCIRSDRSFPCASAAFNRGFVQ